MKRVSCFYHSFEEDGDRIYSQCKNHIKGFCPCETCTDFIEVKEMKRQIEILRKVRERNK